MVGAARSLSGAALSLAVALSASPASGAAGTVGTPVVAAGSCRDGAPNGAYELRIADGRLRVLGAFAKGKRTGTFLFWTASGARVAVIPYDDDAKTGTVALWYETASPGGEPRRKLESAYSGGVLHGLTRSWHANGNRRAEYRYERGELAAADAWGRSGEPLSSDAARRQAENDRRTDAAYYSRLEQRVAEHPPPCD